MDRTLFARVLGVLAVAVALVVGVLAGSASAQVAAAATGTNSNIQTGGHRNLTASAALPNTPQSGVAAASDLGCGYNYGPGTAWVHLYNHCGDGKVWVAVEINWGWSDTVWTCVSPTSWTYYTNLDNRVPGRNITYAYSYGQSC